MSGAPPEMPVYSDKASDFRLVEYGAIRNEITERLTELWKLEKFALGGAAAIAAWLLTHRTEFPKGDIAWWLPCTFLVVCLARFLAGMYHLTFRTSAYSIRVEHEFLGKVGGYEKWFRAKGPNETIAFTVVWLGAVAAALYLALKVGA